jgi:hypothetical protein
VQQNGQVVQNFQFFRPILLEEITSKHTHAGGRMSTNRQEVNGATVRADMGAQLLAATPQCGALVRALCCTTKIGV